MFVFGSGALHCDNSSTASPQKALVTLFTEAILYNQTMPSLWTTAISSSSVDSFTTTHMLSVLLFLLMFADTEANSSTSVNWPSEGIDYLSMELRKPIFDMSILTNEDVTLAGGLVVKRPVNIVNVNPNFDLKIDQTSQRTGSLSTLARMTALRASSSWAAAGEFQLALKTKTGLKPKEDIFPAFEVGGSRDSEYLFSRRETQSVDKEIATSTASFIFAKVYTELPSKARFTDSFIMSMTLLPKRASWEDLADSERRVYRSFLSDYGTHYAKEADFGGSYESSLAVESCSLAVLQSQGSDLSTCNKFKVGYALDVALDLAGTGIPVQGEDCRGLTTGGKYLDQWNSTIVTSSHRWQGGTAKFSRTTELTVDLAQRWIEDIQQNPRTLVKRIDSIANMFHQILTAFDLPDESCPACVDLRNAGMNASHLRQMVSNMDEAFEEYLVNALEDKFEMEEQCDKTCGPCNKPPESGCTCPKESPELCAIDDVDTLVIDIDRIRVSVKRPKKTELKMYIEGLGTSVPPGPYRGEEKITVDISETYLRSPEDTFYIELTKKGWLRDRCIGSTNVRFDAVGNGVWYDLNGPCQHAGQSIEVKSPKVQASGTAQSLFLCPNSTVFYQSDSAFHSHSMKRGWRIFLWIMLGIVGCGICIFVCIFLGCCDEI